MSNTTQTPDTPTGPAPSLEPSDPRLELWRDFGEWLSSASTINTDSIQDASDAIGEAVETL